MKLSPVEEIVAKRLYYREDDLWDHRQVPWSFLKKFSPSTWERFAKKARYLIQLVARAQAQVEKGEQ